MDAEIYVDDECVDAYKCKHAWNEIINVEERPTITVSCYYEGYDEQRLYVYIRNITNGKVSTKVYNGKHIKHTINLTDYGSENLEIYVCLKGKQYANMGPFFKTEPPKWYINTIEAENIRKCPHSYLRSGFEVFDFIGAFMKIQDGRFHFESPTIDKKMFSSQKLKKINQTFLIWQNTDYYTANNLPPMVEFAHEFLKYWNET